ncbi:MAG: mannose-1-phosphate guanylyltransferase/mannose-6-phosphate isomerase [Halomonas sp.]|uniref:mannose-1-phosphate guanylyltransferase/mannose-6-phosphate isomerase n=1 Tax=Halomonas sp. TaxID=1486246 RepID=UPI00287091DB|nr:mannose-1-phosphate guanylyltransferase/mannose-6-phosphate isomerase [Halomonas sp.]MDR9440078.1 mannose-1-phosphate guanylyltransferase/mannose-6-phosphate isomerase [Halomonas sp.]
MTPVILSGGAGSRLWPVSREHYPKQFQRLNASDASLLQEAARRMAGVEALESPLLVCNEEHRFLVAEQLHQIGCHPQRILLEPCGRNTAPAVALAALYAVEQTPEALLLVMPADHVIDDAAAFQAAVEQGSTLAENGKLVTFGITPHRAHTGYGYIRRGAPLEEGGYRVDAFVEKPDAQRARDYLESGDYLWNSGIFLFRADRFLAELEAHAPAILGTCRASFEQRREDLDFLRVGVDAFAQCPGVSIDYAIMEHTLDAAVVPMSPGWSDIGAWDAVHDLKAGDAPDGNVLYGDVLLHDTRNSLVHSHSRLVATVGVQDLVVVETEDAVLVADRHAAQDIKHIVDELKLAGRSEFQALPQVYRPWGHYRTLALTECFRVKEIVVKPGAKLSLQMHHHRAEHWVVVEGTARVTQSQGHGDTEQLSSFLLCEDESTYIPLGTLHRLENPGVIALRLIEVQTGSYLGEDDIVRFDDAYGRS